MDPEVESTEIPETPEIPTAPETPVVESQEESLNPAWNSLLSELPDEFKSRVTPTLRDWDKNYQRDTGKLKEQVQSFTPYQEFAESKIDPDELRAGLQIVNEIRSNPQGFYQRLAEALGQGQQDQKDPEEDSDDVLIEQQQDISSNPYVQQIEQRLQQQEQVVQEAVLQVESAKEVQKIQAQLDSLQEQHGEQFDPAIVLQIATALQKSGSSNDPISDATNLYLGIGQKFAAPVQSPGASAPRIMPSGGGFPQGNADAELKKMSTEDRLAFLMSQGEGQI